MAELVEAIAKAEAASTSSADGDDSDELPELDELKAQAAEMEKKGLIDPANLDIFATWYFFGGPQHGMTPMEVAAMPSAMRKDFQFILGELEKAKKRVKRVKPKRKNQSVR